LGRLELAEEFADGLHLAGFDERQLPEFFRILAVVREVVVLQRDSGDRGGTADATVLKCDDPRRVGLKSQGDKNGNGLKL